MPRLIFTLPLLICVVYGQTGYPADVYRVGRGVSAPKIVRKTEPSYSPEALAAAVQGDVLFKLVVDEQGQATNIKVVNPLGFGLDERAQEAVSSWQFKPGRKDGKAVKIAAQISVHFGFNGRPKAQELRSQLNGAVQQLQGNSQQKEQALQTIQDLAEKKVPEAMYKYGQLLAAGKEIPMDLERSRGLIAAAADANHGPAIFALVAPSIERKQPLQDPESTRELIRKAANFGSLDALYFLGSAYEKGDSRLGFQKDDDRSLYYYRLCAAAGVLQCQSRPGELLLNGQTGPEFDVAEAIAWLELSSNQGKIPPTGLGQNERASLSQEQLMRVTTLKQILVHPQSTIFTPAGTR